MANDAINASSVLHCGRHDPALPKKPYAFSFSRSTCCSGYFSLTSCHLSCMSVSLSRTSVTSATGIRTCAQIHRAWNSNDVASTGQHCSTVTLHRQDVHLILMHSSSVHRQQSDIHCTCVVRHRCPAINCAESNNSPSCGCRTPALLSPVLAASPCPSPRSRSRRSPQKARRSRLCVRIVDQSLCLHTHIVSFTAHGISAAIALKFTLTIAWPCRLHDTVQATC